MQYQKLWQASEEKIKNSYIYDFAQKISEKYGLIFKDYQSFHEWSVSNIPAFWSEAWEYFDIIHSRAPRQIIDDINTMPGAKWFSGSRLNFAENLLRYRDERTAIIARREDQSEESYSYSDLYKKTAALAAAMRNAGVKKGDRIAGFMPNIPETIIAMLAASSIGAVSSSSSPDFGIRGVLDRFSQIKPKLIFSVDGYYYRGKRFDLKEKLKGILNELPSVEKVIIHDYAGQADTAFFHSAVLWDDFLEKDAGDIDFEQLPFDHPLYIMYSSGTTGLPKSMVHSAGGTLIQHLKELVFHTDLDTEDVIFYFTTCGWMMWNWLVTSLATGATVVLFDGNPFWPGPDALLKMADELEISVFGTSAKYISSLQQAAVVPKDISDFPKLRAILSTGSPLSEESFDYVYQKWKAEVQLASISGGTDIISCFMLGNPVLPVYKGEIQCKGLGMDIDCFDEQGQSLIEKQGELVCKSPFPSMPVYFWNDKDGRKYHSAYFDHWPGIWRHGDFLKISTHGGISMNGRSDATLNPGGVRIGTAEIYRTLETIEGLEDSVAVGQEYEGDERIVLFVKLAKDKSLDEALIKEIKLKIKSQCTPRHVPALIVSAPDIPYTINGKKVELAVRKLIHGKDVLNRDALANPESLEFYKNALKNNT